MGRIGDVARFTVPVAPGVDIRRNHDGRVFLRNDNPYAEIRYTIDDPDSTGQGTLYQGPFDFSQGGVIRAKAVGEGLVAGPEREARFDFLIPRSPMRVIYADSEHPGEGEAGQAIDGNPSTFWHTKWGESEPKPPHEIQVELGACYELTAVTYLPRQDSDHGRIAKYQLYLSNDKTNWGSPVREDTFPASAELQRIALEKPVAARYVRLAALSEVGGRAWTTIAELDFVAMRCVR
jgi:beta-galactosidase